MANWNNAPEDAQFHDGHNWIKVEGPYQFFWGPSCAEWSKLHVTRQRNLATLERRPTANAAKRTEGLVWPLTELPEGGYCYVAAPELADLHIAMCYVTDHMQPESRSQRNALHQLKHGMLYPYTEEGRLAAIEHAKFMLP